MNQNENQKRQQQIVSLCRQARKAISEGKRLNLQKIVERYSHLQPELEQQLRAAMAAPEAPGARGNPAPEGAQAVDPIAVAPATQTGGLPAGPVPVASPAPVTGRKKMSLVTMILIGVGVCVGLWLGLFVVTYFVLNNRYERIQAERMAEEEREAEAMESAAQARQVPSAVGDEERGGRAEFQGATDSNIRGDEQLPAPLEEQQIVTLDPVEEEGLEELEFSMEVMDFEEIELAEVEQIDDSTGADEPVEFPMEREFAEAIEQLNEDELRARFLGVYGTRSGTAREAAIRRYGITPEATNAVTAALEWIAGLQNSDGNWHLDLTIDGRPSGYSNPGDLEDAKCGATALALLAFLGDGHTHKDGEYKEQVGRGLQFLKMNMDRDTFGFSWREAGGSMYSHGLVALAFCEAYGMTRDPNLESMAEMAVEYIDAAQDPVGGGWRYSPRQAGDTSVTGWQLSAIFAAHNAGLTVNRKTIGKAGEFLESVSRDGTFYGYTDLPEADSPRAALTAAGLYCRMHYGWTPDDPAMKAGLDWFAERGPSRGEHTQSYQNYYATLLMHNAGEYYRDSWNALMIPYLVEQQDDDGSWMFNADQHTEEKGGRLTVTALNCLILEACYRHVPLYGAGPVLEFELPQ